MNILIQTLKSYQQKLSADSLYQNYKELDKIKYLYPFNKIEHIFVGLMAENVMTLDEYEKIKHDYEERNPYLSLFTYAPRTFGETWGEPHILRLLPELIKASKQTDPNFKGEYDLTFEGMKIEVKASRAVKQHSGGSMVEKALRHADGVNFLMNFQQLKPALCDAFIWIGVWTDKIEYWVIPADDVKNNPGFSNQHRKQNMQQATFEGQIHINRSNYAAFDRYKVDPDEILSRLKILKS